MKLQKDERIVTAFAEYCAGPGWSNKPIWVIVGGPKGMRRECIQPEEQTVEMCALFSISAAVQSAMRAATDNYYKEGGKSPS